MFDSRVESLPSLTSLSQRRILLKYFSKAEHRSSVFIGEASRFYDLLRLSRFAESEILLDALESINGVIFGDYGDVVSHAYSQS